MAKQPGSILAADFGNVYTRVVLLDLVDGVYRLVATAHARTTVGYPFNDVNVGFDRALQDLSETTRRKFTGPDGRLMIPEKVDHSGVDFFLATASTGQPMRTVVIGLVPGVSVDSALRAAAGTYSLVTQAIHLDDGRSEEDRLNVILLDRPDLVFIVGGTEAGARDAVLELAKLAKLAVSLIDQKHRPSIVYSGNSALGDKIRELFEGIAPVIVTSNVRPTLDEEDLDPAELGLATAYDEYKEQHGEGFETVSGLSAVGVLPTAQSYTIVAEYLATTQTNRTLMAIDMGSAVSTLAVAQRGHVSTRIRPDIGLGDSAYTLLQAVGLEEIRRWVPFNVTPVEIVNYALNKTLRPASIPMNLRELYLEHALLRAGIAEMVNSLGLAWARSQSEFGTVIGAGSALTGTGSPGYTAMLLLDALEPKGVTTLLADPYGLIPALGAAALAVPEATVQMFDDEPLERLGTSICLSGEAKPGKPALHVKFIIDDEVFEHEVEGGHLWVLPLGAGKRVKLQLRVLTRDLHIGGKRKLTLTVEGGTAGLIFDVRGRPLPLAADVRGRAAQLPMWMSEATGDPLRELDERWLIDLGGGDAQEMQPVEVIPANGRKAAKPRRERRGLFGRRGKQKDSDTIGSRLAAFEKPSDAALFRDMVDEKDEADELQDLRDELSP